MKSITIPYKDKNYELTYTRDTVKYMEQQGFDLNKLSSKTLTTVEDLFKGAFRANHKGVKAGLINEIFQQIGDRETLVTKLAEMYVDPIESLLNDPDNEKNVEWTANW